MTTLKKISAWIAVIIAILLIIAFILPRTYKVERSIYMKANAQAIYDLVCNLNKWDLWEPWTKESDSTATFSLVGNDCEKGTMRKWDGKKIGDGEMTITDLVPGQQVMYDLSFFKGKYKSHGGFTIENKGDSCHVTWMDTGDLEYNPVSRYMGLFMGMKLGPDFEKGLAKLKKVAEEQTHWPRIEQKQMEEKLVLMVRDSAGPKTYGEVLGKGFMEIGDVMKKNRLKQSGAPFAIFIKWDSVTMNSVMDMGIPVDRTVATVRGRVRFERIPAQQVMMAYYFGPYEKTAVTYRALEKTIEEAGKHVAGGPVEIYVTDPTTEKDTMKWETDIFFPIR
jgi:effector-binding domain-containing protein